MIPAKPKEMMTKYGILLPLRTAYSNLKPPDFQGVFCFQIILKGTEARRQPIESFSSICREATSNCIKISYLYRVRPIACLICIL